MNRRRLGNSDLEVSVLGLGSWLTYGVSVDRETCRACIATAFDCGINFFDTANMYGRGAAETVLGDVLADYPRHSFLIGTKVYYPMSNGRSIAEFVRLLKALQTSDENGVATPENWQPGEKVIVPPPATAQAAQEREKEGYEYTDWYFSKKSL